MDSSKSDMGISVGYNRQKMFHYACGEEAGITGLISIICENIAKNGL